MESSNRIKENILQRIEKNYKGLGQQHSYIVEAVKFLQGILIEHYDETFVSFNGGKDATIVLVLTYLALRSIEEKGIKISKKQLGQSHIPMPQSLYFEEPNPFPQMTQFYQSICRLFNLKCHTLASKKYAQQLTTFSQNNPLSCTIMGSRNDDPYCEHLGLITQSDTEKGYPAFKRINPIIKWKYEHVWDAIKTLQIPYCILYEEGYTSIGNRDNTVKNPTLVCKSSGKCIKPFQANPETERICRVGDRSK